MHVSTITMPEREAKEKLRAVRSVLHRRADAEYKAMEAGLVELVRGRTLINLADTFRVCPIGSDQRPRLAIGRADRKQVQMRRSGTAAVFDTRWDSFRRVKGAPTRVRVELGRETTREPVHRWEQPHEGYALVPIIPPEHAIPASHLPEHLILWEVEQWSDRPLGAQPDRDPLLLKPLAGDLYVVVASWDLTDLERAIMAGRAH